jgi:hypothetical protein
LHGTLTASFFTMDTCSRCSAGSKLCSSCRYKRRKLHDTSNLQHRCNRCRSTKLGSQEARCQNCKIKDEERKNQRQIGDVARGLRRKMLLYTTHRSIDVTTQTRLGSECLSELTRWRDGIKRKNRDLHLARVTIVFDF